MKLGMDRNVDSETGKTGTEAAYVVVGNHYLFVRWRSAQDGRTPMLSFGWHRNDCLRGRTWYIRRPVN